jgi:hypothetical protein
MQVKSKFLSLESTYIEFHGKASCSGKHNTTFELTSLEDALLIFAFLFCVFGSRVKGIPQGFLSLDVVRPQKHGEETRTKY